MGKHGNPWCLLFPECVHRLMVFSVPMFFLGGLRCSVFSVLLLAVSVQDSMLLRGNGAIGHDGRVGNGDDSDASSSS